MLSQTVRYTAIGVTSLLTLLFAFSSVIFAVSHESTAQQTQNQQQTTQEEAKKKLEGALLEACQQREAAINQRSEALAQKAENMDKRFDSITGQIQDFYTEEVVGKGLELANYAQLMGEIATKQAAVDEALAVAAGEAGNFSCSGDDPKGQIQSFKVNMTEVIDAMKEYRQTLLELVKALLATVKTAPEATDSAQPTEDATVGEE